jgi:hypothetical protein
LYADVVIQNELFRADLNMYKSQDLLTLKWSLNSSLRFVKPTVLLLQSTWWFIDDKHDDLPIKNGDFPVRYLQANQRINHDKSIEYAEDIPFQLSNFK